MRRAAERASWMAALLLFAIYGLWQTEPPSQWIGVGLLIAAWLTLRRRERGAQTVLACGLMILGGFIHLAQAVEPLHLLLAVAQVLWAVVEIRRFRQELERDG
jgi:hypothetical protein